MRTVCNRAVYSPWAKNTKILDQAKLNIVARIKKLQVAVISPKQKLKQSHIISFIMINKMTENSIEALKFSVTLHDTGC